MKLRKIVVAFLLVWAGSSWAGLPLEAQDQGRKFTVRVENVTMKEAIEAIKEKGDYSFLIRNKDIDLTRKVTVDVNEGTLIPGFSIVQYSFYQQQFCGGEYAFYYTRFAAV